MPRNTADTTERHLGFFAELREQRWDDHRLYHHSRINQSLHLLSALSFLTSYAFLTVSPALAATVGWLLAMTSRQAGHFFFEPKGYDQVNNLTNERKEEIKVGYNIRRKIVLLSVWGASPIVLWMQPTLFGLLDKPVGTEAWLQNLAKVWLALGAAGLLFRTVQLFFVRDVQTGLVWATKILTDPFHDVKLYHRAPLYLLRGQLIDPMLHVSEEEMDAAEELDEEDPELKPAG
jgi:hypothetical protein